jgi:hypothetical protein
MCLGPLNSNLNYLHTHKIRASKETSIPSMQVVSSKFTVLKIIEGRNFGEVLDILPSPLIMLKNQTDFQKLVYSRIFNSKSMPILNLSQKGKLSLFFHSFYIKCFILFEVREMWSFIFQSDEFLCHQEIRGKRKISMGPACHPPPAPTWPSLRLSPTEEKSYYPFCGIYSEICEIVFQ